MENAISDYVKINGSERELIVFHLFRMGMGRDMVRRYIEYIWKIIQDFKRTSDPDIGEEEVIRRQFNRLFRFDNIT